MTVMQYASNFSELLRFALDFVASGRMKMRRFEEGLAFYIRNKLAGQPIKTYQELYERAVEVERVKNMLRALNPGNQKRKWNDCGTSSDNVASKKPVVTSAKSRIIGSPKRCGKCGRTNHRTLECHVGTNKCMWCGSIEHMIATCPRQLKAVEKRVVKPLVPPRQIPVPQKPPALGRAYKMS